MRRPSLRGRRVSASDLVELDSVTVSYGGHSLLGRRREPIVAVDDVSLSMSKGQSTGIVGGTGAGKSTIAKLVMGMVAPTSGSVRVAGHDTAAKGADRHELQRLRQVVMQDPFSSLDSRMSVRDIIAEPLTLGRRVKRGELDARVEELLTMVGLSPSRAKLYPHQFSGGQRQRISIARALAPRPELIVLDEPTSALDVSVRAQILLLLKRLQDELGVTYLIISHDMVTVAYLASNVVVMSAGRIVEEGPTTQLFRSPEHEYTRELIASMPTTPTGSWQEQLDAPTEPDPAPIGGTA
jgi:peptide/nickel transport system ATP-binding protein